MKTNIDIAIESQTRDVSDWLFELKAGTEDFDTFQKLTDERKTEICNEYGVSEDFMYELIAHVGTLADAVHQDLADIWKRMDAMEKER